MNKTIYFRAAAAIAGAIVMFLITAAVLAAEPGPLPAAESQGIADASLTTGAAKTAKAGGRVLRVRCNKGETLTRALRRAQPADTIHFTGTCYESIVIDTDDLTIRGSGQATIDGSHKASEAVVFIDGARAFDLKQFVVQNGSDQGILATHQAQGRLDRLTVQANGTVGLSVDRSHLEITDLALDNNGTGGMDAYTTSTVVAFGNISASGNGGDGIAVNGETFLELRGARIVAGNNAGTGVSVINDSRLQIFSFPEAQGSGIVADGNGFAGVGILGAKLGVVGAEYFGSGANVISASNNIFGFFMPAGAILSPHATARFVASNNGVGMLLEDGASALIVGGLDITGNGTGISAHGAGTLTLVSVPPNPSTVDINQVDLDLGFGTRVTADQVAHTTVACDSTVLVRGIACP